MKIVTKKSLLPAEKPGDIEACVLILLSRTFTINEGLEKYITRLIESHDYAMVEDLKTDSDTEADYKASPFLCEKDRAVHQLAVALAEWRAKGKPGDDYEISLPGRDNCRIASLTEAVCQYHTGILNAWARRRVQEGKGS